MSYEPYYHGGWKSGESGGTPITPEAMNHMEKGIARSYAPRNLLDNSNFSNPVNQRGGALYAGAAGYTIDRWKVPSKLDVGVEEGYIHLGCVSDTTRNGLSQYLPSDRIPKAGTKVTLACMDTQGQIHCGCGAWPASGYVRAFGGDTGFAGNLYPDRIGLLVGMDEAIELVWACLRIGEYTVDTWPDYQPKEYSAELLECQRYYWKMGAVSGVGYTYSTNVAYVSITLPIQMRITPTLTASEDLVFTIRCAGQKYENVKIGSNIYMASNQIRFSLDIADLGLAANEPIHVIKTGGTLELSADL